MSRIKSNSMSNDLEVACREICGISLDEMVVLNGKMMAAYNSVNEKEDRYWVDLLESNLA